MPHAQHHRGAHPEDARLFANERRPQLQAASREGSYLLSRGYPPDPTFDFVGGHHQLHARERLALRRIACSDAQLAGRRARLLPIEQAAHGALFIDGFNLIITLEVALSGGLLFRGRDGALRDLAGLRGSYHPVDETEAALRMLGEGLRALAVTEVLMFLDAPVSNSGRLRARVLEHAAAWTQPAAISPISVDVELVPDADRELSEKPRVVSADSVVLDRCASWLNLSSYLIERFVPGAQVIDLRLDSASDLSASTDE